MSLLVAIGGDDRVIQGGEITTMQRVISLCGGWAILPLGNHWVYRHSIGTVYCRYPMNDLVGRALAYDTVSYNSVVVCVQCMEANSKGTKSL